VYVNVMLLWILAVIQVEVKGLPLHCYIFSQQTCNSF